MAKKPRTRVERWEQACSVAEDGLVLLRELQEDYEEWRENMPESLDGSAVADKLDAVIDLGIEDAMLTIEEAQGLELPLGFGRD